MVGIEMNATRNSFSAKSFTQINLNTNQVTSQLLLAWFEAFRQGGTPLVWPRTFAFDGASA